MTAVFPNKVVAAIRADLAKLRKPTVPAVRVVLGKYRLQLKTANGNDILSVARELAQSSDFAPRLIGFELLAGNQSAFQQLKSGDIERWAIGLSDWGNVDLFGCTIVGQAWREGIIKDALIKKWAKSSDRWLRRLSLVVTVPLNNKTRGGHGDPARTLAIGAMHLDDRDDMVVKALSWALRELAKRDAEPVAEFVKQHRGRLAPRVQREVANKLTTGLKNPK